MPWGLPTRTPPPVVEAPTTPITLWMVAFAAVQLCIVVSLFRARTRSDGKGNWLLQTAHLQTPLVLVWMTLAYMAVHSWCPHSRACEEPVFDSKIATIWAYTPLIIFPLTMGEGLMLLAMQMQSGQRPAVSWFMHLVIASTASATTYYLLNEGFGRCATLSIFDRPMYPYHYCMWMTTMHMDLLTMHSLGMHIYKGSERIIHDRWLFTGLLNTQALFAAAFLGNYLRVGLFWNIFFILVAFTCFGWVLSVTSGLLKLVEARGGGGPTSKKRLYIIRVCVCIKWIFYTVIWAAAALGLVSMQTEALLLTAIDVGKAFLAICAWAMTL